MWVTCRGTGSISQAFSLGTSLLECMIARYAENGKFEEMLNQFHQTKDPWLAIVLHKMGLGRIVTSFPTILYFVVDMPFLKLMEGYVV